MDVSSNNHTDNIGLHRHSIAIQVDSSLSSNSDNEDEPAESIQLLCECQLRFIDEDDVPELPKIYPRILYPLIFRPDCVRGGVDDNINNNNVVKKVINVGLIGQRLCHFFHSNNLGSVYDNQRGRIFCSSPNVSFVVQFWKTTTRKYYDEASAGAVPKEKIMILEIQRRQGCSFTMQKIRSALKKSVVLPSSSSFSTANIIRYEKLFQQQQQSYIPSPHIKRMYQKRLSAPPRLLALRIIGIDKQMFSSLSSSSTSSSE